MDDLDQRINFRVRFTCRCGEDKSDMFILKESNGSEVKVLCGRCERQYWLLCSSREIPINMNVRKEYAKTTKRKSK
jgi:hypothetical protein